MTAPGPYQVELLPAARQQLRKLEEQTARRVVVELANLQIELRPPGCRATVGQSHRWHIRVAGAGDYPIVYEIRDHQLLVLVITIAHRPPHTAHRREVYR